MPKCKFRSYLLQQRQAYIVHRLWITVGPDIFCTPSVDYSTAGRLFTPSVDYSTAGHFLHHLWIAVGPDVYLHRLWITVRPDIFVHHLWITVGPDIYLHRLWIKVGPDIYLHRLDYSRTGYCTPSVDYSRAGHLLYTVGGLQYGRTFIVHYLWITVGPDIYLHHLWITIGPDVYCTPTVDYSRAGYTSALYTICVVFYPICKSLVCSISLA